MEKAGHYQIRDAYLNANKRLFFLDYEGTLAPVKSADKTPVFPEPLNELLFSMTNNPQNQVIVISCQPKEALEDWFNYLPLTLVAENGGFLRISRNQWQSMSKDSLVWKNFVYRALETLTLRYQGSVLESKHFSLTWHYNSIGHEIPVDEKRQLEVALRSLARTHKFILHDDNQVMEFISPGISKGKFAATWVGDHGQYDFILAVGDDWTDEDLFETIGKEYFTIKVGNPSNSAARYYLDTQADVIPFLNKIMSAKN